MSGRLAWMGFPPAWGAVRGVVPDRASFVGAVFACVLALGGCADRERPAAADPLGERLARSVALAAGAFEDLARIEGARGPEVGLEAAPEDLPPELRRRVEASWTGPLAGAVRWLAGEAGYGFREMGAAPARPVTVALPGAPARVFDLLREAGFQAGARALVRVDARRRTVAVVYLDGAGGGER